MPALNKARSAQVDIVDILQPLFTNVIVPFLKADPLFLPSHLLIPSFVCNIIPESLREMGSFLHEILLIFISITDDPSSLKSFLSVLSIQLFPYGFVCIVCVSCFFFFFIPFSL